MGCDIHLFTEIKKKDKWVHSDYFRRNRYYKKGNENESKFTVASIFNGRDYRLFSVLAGVRNYSKNIPISEPRGLPDNTCKFIKKESKYWGVGGHSHSYLTLQELKNWQEKNEYVLESGLLYPDQEKDLDNGIFPDSWCRSSSDSENMNYREWKRPRKILYPIIKKLEEIIEEEFYIYSEKYDEDIRIVFWFDN